MDIKKLLTLLQIDDLHIYFQPIFSIGSKKVIGLEALLRGIRNGEVVSPLKLFEIAEKKGLKVELDRAARYLAFSNFKNFFENSYNITESLYLFFNFDASILDESRLITWYIYRLAEMCKISPSQIVIEITETKVKNFEILKNFVNTYRELGFLIALDDVGIDYSNLNRIIEIKPDFIKVDKILIDGLSKNEYKCKLIKSLADLTKQIGSFILAEGIETEEDLFKTLELGIDFHQGFFLEVPLAPEKISLQKYHSKLEKLSKKFTTYYLKHVISYKKQLYDLYKKIVNEFAEVLKKVQEEKFEETLKNLIYNYKFIQTGYIVNNSSQLCTSIIFNKNFQKPYFYEKLLPILFKKGDTLPLYPHVLYILSGEYNQFISDPYIHFLTRKEVTTVSKLFFSFSKSYILCIDFLIIEKQFN